MYDIWDENRAAVPAKLRVVVGWSEAVRPVSSGYDNVHVSISGGYQVFTLERYIGMHKVFDRCMFKSAWLRQYWYSRCEAEVVLNRTNVFFREY